MRGDAGNSITSSLRALWSNRCPSEELRVWSAWCEASLIYKYEIANSQSSAEDLSANGEYDEYYFGEDNSVRSVSCNQATVPESESIYSDGNNFYEQLYWVKSQCSFLSADDIELMHRSGSYSGLSEFVEKVAWESSDSSGYYCTQEDGCLSVSNSNAFLKCVVEDENVKYTTTCSTSRLMKGKSPAASCICEHADFVTIDENCVQQSGCNVDGDDDGDACDACKTTETCQCNWISSGWTEDRHGIAWTSMNFFQWAMNDYQYEEKYYENTVRKYNLTEEWTSVAQSNPSAMNQDLTVKMEFSCPSNKLSTQKIGSNAAMKVQHFIIVVLTVMVGALLAILVVRLARRVKSRPKLGDSTADDLIESKKASESSLETGVLG